MVLPPQKCKPLAEQKKRPLVVACETLLKEQQVQAQLERLNWDVAGIDLALRQHGVGVDTLSKTLADQVVMAPTGRLSLGYQDVPIEVRSLPLTTEEVRRLPVPTPDGSVPLEALARVIRAPEPIHCGLDLDGEPSLALIVFKQPGASTVPVTRAVAETLDALQGELPASIRWQLIYDQGSLVHGNKPSSRRRCCSKVPYKAFSPITVIGPTRRRNCAWLPRRLRGRTGRAR
jgi:hypothetical protein